MPTQALQEPPAPPEVAPSPTVAVRCPIRWTCPVCRQTVPAGYTHPHLVAVLGATSGQAHLTELTRHPGVAGLDLVRALGDDPAWLVWSHDQSFDDWVREGEEAVEASDRSAEPGET